MSDFKLLIDTNVVIGLEDAQPVQAKFAELVRLSSRHGVRLFVDGANYDDVGRDANVARRDITLSKLEKFERLRGVPLSDRTNLELRFGRIKNDNDESDARLLAAIEAKAADFLVTQDNGLRRRAEQSQLGLRVFTIEESVVWLQQTFEPAAISLPYIFEKKAYEINRADAIFSSLRDDYPGFDEWFDRCRKKHRDCWTLEIDGSIAGLVIRKDETHDEAQTHHTVARILKVCTFKVRDEYRGEKFGELLLKQIIWFAQRNSYQLVYLTVFPKHEFLIDLLANYGFEKTKDLANREIVMEKPISLGPLLAEPGDTLAFDRKHYPRFYEGEGVRKFCVPIRPSYHTQLFPEVGKLAELPLFRGGTDEHSVHPTSDRTPGNTIRKVYLCRAKSKRIRPGDIIVFYVSKDEVYAASQCITTIGVVEQVNETSVGAELVRLTAKRSVFSAGELQAMSVEGPSPVRVIDFLLVGHAEPFVTLAALRERQIFGGHPPQSIAEITNERYQALRAHLRLSVEP